MTRIDQARGVTGVAGSGRLWIGTVVSAALVLTVLWYLAATPYGKTSEKGYDVAVALYKVCNQRNSAGLQQVSVLVEEAASEDQLSDDEYGWLRAIIDHAESGDWSQAQSQTRELLEAQVDRRSP